MEKRTFIKTTTALAGGALLSGVVSCNPPVKKERIMNWAGNFEFSTDHIHYPKTLEEVQEIVKKSLKLTSLGSQHSFNKIADNTENLVSLKEMNKVIGIDRAAGTVTVEGGMRYGDLAPYLHQNGYALHNLASLPHITIAGSVATATHGSGVNNGNLSTGIVAIEFVNAAGEIINLSKNDAAFTGAIIGLGALGIVTKLTLAIEPTFNMKQYVYRNMPMHQLEKNFDTIEKMGCSVSLFTDWKNKNITEVWIKSKVAFDDIAAPPELFGAKLATQNMHPLEGESAENCTEQMGVSGPWFERMPHFKMGFKPSAGKELQSEYFVAISHAYEAMLAIEKLNEKITPHLFISEIRTIAADELWMSPCYKKNCVAVHFTWKQDVEAVMNLLPLIEAQLAPFNPRPHWGKLFTMAPEVLQARIEKLADFKQLVKQHDPNGKFKNAYLERNIFGV